MAIHDVYTTDTTVRCACGYSQETSNAFESRRFAFAHATEMRPALIRNHGVPQELTQTVESYSGLARHTNNRRNNDA